MKRLLIAILLATSTILASDDIKGPALTLYQMVATSTDKVMEVLKQNKSSETQNPEELAQTLLSLIEPIVDFDSIAKSVMGKYYDTATPQQKKEFEVNFKNTLATLYSKALVKFDIDSITVNKPSLDDPEKGKITMDVKAANGNTYSIVYSMRLDAEKGWKIRNVILDGINLGLTYRNQFYSSADNHQGDLQKVIEDWSKEMKE